MSRKSTLVKGFFYLSVFSLFVIFYVKDLTIDFAKGRSTMTSRYQKVQTVEFPTVTICMKPGYKNSVTKKYELVKPKHITRTIPNGSIPILFDEISYIRGRDYDFLYRHGNLMKYTTSPIHTNHHGTCYKLQPLTSVTKGLHIMRHCDNATICDVILILASHFTFNKVRHNEISSWQVKIYYTATQGSKSIKCDSFIFESQILINTN